MKDVSSFLCVLDASVALSWVMPDEPANLSLISRLSAGYKAMVPPYWLAEMLNALLMATRRNRFSLASAHDSTALLQRLPHHVQNIPPTQWNAWLALAAEYQLTLYDAGYLHLAKHYHLPLATADKALIRAAKSLNIDLITA